MKKILYILLYFILCAFIKKTRSHKNYVPDEKTAIKIAEAVWLPLYDKDIYKKKPFVAKLENDRIWNVQGTLKHRLGGVPHAYILKKDGKILSVFDDK